MTLTILTILSIAGASVPFALNNQQTPDGVFSGYTLFTCAECLSFWLSIIALMLIGSNPVLAGLAPIFTLAIKRYLV